MQFEQDVLARSQEIPVVVDFWAPWCGPCRILGPVIEQLAAAQQGKWELVKVNTEEHPELGERYDVFSIPNVKMFYKGQVTGEFVGAIPKTAIERWLEEHLPNSSKDGLAQILAALENGENPEALAQLEAFVQQNPGIAEASLALASHVIARTPAQAKELVAAIQLGHPLFDQAEDIRTLAEWFELPADNGSPAA
ncbi:MAG: thioredoxin, partial [Saprospiraceae bacterium]|nr:thioredoxin [Saprospiraceae bacterium]